VKKRRKQIIEKIPSVNNAMKKITHCNASIAWRLLRKECFFRAALFKHSWKLLSSFVVIFIAYFSFSDHPSTIFVIGKPLTAFIAFFIPVTNAYYSGKFYQLRHEWYVRRRKNRKYI
jgi:hypothetical protein